MKITTKVIGLLALILGMNVTGLSQDVSPEIPTEEIQPLLLTDSKITFYAQQIDFSSIEIKALNETAGEVVLPRLIPSSDNTTITIDFSDCETGTYLINATRDELILAYLIEHKK